MSPHRRGRGRHRRGDVQSGRDHPVHGNTGGRPGRIAGLTRPSSSPRTGYDLARTSLALTSTDWNDVGDGRLVRPVPNDDVPINDEESDVEAEVDSDPTLVRTDLSTEEAQEHDEYVEESHGGDVQPGTTAQADRVDGVDADVSRWGTRGYLDKGTNAFVSWHIPSYSMSRASYPQFDEVSEHEHDYAVSFNGTCTRNVEIGGQAPHDLRIEIREAINAALTDAGADVRAELGTDTFRIDATRRSSTGCRRVPGLDRSESIGPGVLRRRDRGCGRRRALHSFLRTLGRGGSKEPPLGEESGRPVLRSYRDRVGWSRSRRPAFIYGTHPASRSDSRPSSPTSRVSSR